jgi:hypothetical protein
MSSAQRLKGQEVSVIYVRGGVLEDTLTDTKDFEFEPKLELKEQGYLGEKTNRYDEIFNGAKFTGTLHLHTQDFFTFQNAIIARAQRQTPDVVFNISAVMNFPNGDTPTVLLPDVKFGENPTKIGSRGDYVEVRVTGACSDYDASTS